LRSFYGKTFFFLNPKWRLVSRWHFCHFKITLFSKNPLQAMTNTKTKILMDLQSMYTLKKIINWSTSEKIQYGAENQDGCEFRIFVQILLPQHGLCLNL
jgi:hypothetical protein